MSNYRTKKRTLVLAMAVGSATAAYAGLKSSQQVVITSTNAKGSVGAVRSSSDTFQHIGCQQYNVGTTPYVHCFAQNHDTTDQLGCFVADNEAISLAAAGINIASYISFYIDTSTGRCSTLYVWNNSRFAPMQP